MAPFRKLRTALGLRKGRPSRYVSIGRHSYAIGEHTVFGATAANPVVIGAFCSIAEGVQIHGETNHPVHRVSTFPFKAVLKGATEPGLGKGAVTIGSDVWVGARAIILSNLSIGHGAVIGAGSVVTRDVPPYAIVAGNPARLIRYRFEPDIVAALLGIAWWEWSDAKIRSEIDLFYGSVEDFVARHRVA